MAFVSQLYYWGKADAGLMDECFRASGRMRPKWDDTRGEQTYGGLTIAKVCESNSDIFGGDYV
jgi:putative DNA primase/helicase